MLFLDAKIRLTRPEQTWVQDLLRIDASHIDTLEQLHAAFQAQLVLLDLSQAYDRLYHKMLVRLYDELLEGADDTQLEYRIAS